MREINQPEKVSWGGGWGGGPYPRAGLPGPAPSYSHLPETQEEALPRTQ